VTLWTEFDWIRIRVQWRALQDTVFKLYIVINMYLHINACPNKNEGI
jgi:hypothetical protein